MPPHYHHGIGHLSAVLKKAGHATGLKVYDRPVEREQLISDVKAFSPDMVAFSAATNQYKYARKYSSWIVEATHASRPQKPIMVVGGVHPTLDPEGVIQHPAWDFLVIGEADLAFSELTQAIQADRDPSSIGNVWGRKGGEIFRNAVRPLVTDLDSLPFPDREVFDREHLLRGERGAMSLLAGRGCPYGCAYCCNPAFQRLYRGGGKWVRRRSAENILAEIKSLADSYPIKFLYFDDDVFTLDREWTLDFVARYKSSFKFPFRVNVRVETADREMLAALKDAGCDMIQVGVEHGDEEFRRKALRRPMSNAQIENIFRWADEVGLRTWSFNIIGFPGETPELARATIELNKRIRPDHLQVAVFNPYPGTPLYDESVEKGYFSKDDDPSDGFFNPESGLNLPTFPRDQLNLMRHELVALSERIEDQRRIERKYANRKIYFDLTDMLGEAEVDEPAKGYVKVAYFSIFDDVRRTLQEHPPSKIKYVVNIPRNARFEFSLAVHPEVWEKAKGDGVVFRLEAAPRRIVGKAVAAELFSHHLDPQRRTQDRAWFDFTVDLSDFAGKTMRLELITEMKNNSESDFNTAGWANPLIVEAPNPAGNRI